MAHVNLFIRKAKINKMSSFVTRPVPLSSASTNMHDCSILPTQTEGGASLF